MSASSRTPPFVAFPICSVAGARDNAPRPFGRTKEFLFSHNPFFFPFFPQTPRFDFGQLAARPLGSKPARTLTAAHRDTCGFFWPAISVSLLLDRSFFFAASSLLRDRIQRLRVVKLRSRSPSRFQIGFHPLSLSFLFFSLGYFPPPVPEGDCLPLETGEMRSSLFHLRLLSVMRGSDPIPFAFLGQERTTPPQDRLSPPPFLFPHFPKFLAFDARRAFRLTRKSSFFLAIFFFL